MRTALITGGNRGLGLETGRQLLARGWRVVLACRDLDAGRAAAASLGAGASARELDVSRAVSATALAAALARDGVTLDALVNNAAVSLDGFDARVAERTITTNLFGPVWVTRALAPRVRDGGAVVMVSSGMGELSVLRAPARARVADPALDVAAVEHLAYDFVAAVGGGRHGKDGWPNNAYSVSKALLNAATRAFAAELGPRLTVNAVCPGWVRTALGGRNAPRDVGEGAASIVATVEASVAARAASGGFYRDGKAIPW